MAGNRFPSGVRKLVGNARPPPGDRFAALESFLLPTLAPRPTEPWQKEFEMQSSAERIAHAHELAEEVLIFLAAVRQRIRSCRGSGGAFLMVQIARVFFPDAEGLLGKIRAFGPAPELRLARLGTAGNPWPLRLGLFGYDTVMGYLLGDDETGGVLGDTASRLYGIGQLEIKPDDVTSAHGSLITEEVWFEQAPEIHTVSADLWEMMNRSFPISSLKVCRRVTGDELRRTLSEVLPRSPFVDRDLLEAILRERNSAEDYFVQTTVRSPVASECLDQLHQSETSELKRQNAHSRDFRSVLWNGEQFSFTPTQVGAIQEGALAAMQPSSPDPAALGTALRPAPTVSVNDRMKILIAQNSDAGTSWTIRKFAECLNCSISTVANTAMWRQLSLLRKGERLDAIERRSRFTVRQTRQYRRANKQREQRGSSEES